MFAITLLTLYLFNLAGYPLLFKYLNKASNNQIEQKIDHNNYRESDLVEIKVKLNLPYMTTMGVFEQLSGEININGNNHNYVKRRISGDTLFLLCLPNNQKDRIQSLATEYGNKANDFENTAGSKKVSKKATIYNQFHQPPAEYLLATANFRQCCYNTFLKELIPQFSPLDNGRPPQLFS